MSAIEVRLTRLAHGGVGSLGEAEDELVIDEQRNTVPSLAEQDGALHVEGGEAGVKESEIVGQCIGLAHVMRPSLWFSAAAGIIIAK
ncbi:MAG: hypothetical protein WCD59_04510, partial [Pseudolabrys sp.]